MLREAGFGADEIAALIASRRRRRPERDVAESVGTVACAHRARPAGAAAELLRMSELAERAGVSAATIKHYLREGLLPEPVRRRRNMAWYPREFVERMRLIKQLQEERFMPLKVIREVLEREDAEPERLRALIELEDRILERGAGRRAERSRRDGGRASATASRRRRWSGSRSSAC